MRSILVQPRVFTPQTLDESTFTGLIYGYYFPDTDIFNILAWDDTTLQIFANKSLSLLGRIINSNENELAGSDDDNDDQSQSLGLLGRRGFGGLQFSIAEKKYKKEIYSLTQNIFSRNTGILETDWMLEKTAFILGCGSVGSLVALELARSGVGRFVLVDNDILAFHNLCRHQCGIDDVGAYKVNVLRDRVLAINPYARVETYIGIIEDIPKSVFDAHLDKQAILIGCADNREADVYACSRAAFYGTPFISIGFWERAFAGEIFYFLPDREMPCYECALGNEQGISSRISTNRRIYTMEEDLAKVNFEPGISADINFITIIGVKVILDILNKDNPRFTPRLLPHLTQYTLICNTNNPSIGGEKAEIFAYPLQVTTSIDVQFRQSCPPCKYIG